MAAGAQVPNASSGETTSLGVICVERALLVNLGVRESDCAESVARGEYGSGARSTPPSGSGSGAGATGAFGGAGREGAGSERPRFRPERGEGSNSSAWAAEQKNHCSVSVNRTRAALKASTDFPQVAQ